MLESTFTLDVVGHGLADAVQFVFIGGQPLQAYRPTGMQFAVADSQFSAQAIPEAVSKARGGVVKDAGGVDFIHEKLRCFLVLGENALRMARAVTVDVFDSLVNVAHNFHRDLQIAIFSVPVFFGGGNDLLLREQFGGAKAAAHLDSGRLQRGHQRRKKFFGDRLVHQDLLNRIAGSRILNFGVDDNCLGHAQVGGGINIDMANAAAVAEHGNTAVAKNKIHEFGGAARD